MNIYGILDKKANEIVDVFTRANDTSAVRDITMIAEKNPIFKKYPEDFEIHKYGEIEKDHVNWISETKLVELSALVEKGEVKSVKAENK